MEKLEIGKIYLATTEDGRSYLDGDFNWYVELNEKESERFRNGLLEIQNALFESVERQEDVFTETDNVQDEIDRLQSEIDRLKGLKGE